MRFVVKITSPKLLDHVLAPNERSTQTHLVAREHVDPFLPYVVPPIILFVREQVSSMDTVSHNLAGRRVQYMCETTGLPDAGDE